MRTAQALVSMAKQTNLIGILRKMRRHLHSDVEIGDVHRAVFKDADYAASGGICCIFHEENWSLVLKFAKMSEDKVLADVPVLAPLHELICGATRNVSISNDGGEHSCKVLAAAHHPPPRASAPCSPLRALCRPDHHSRPER